MARPKGPNPVSSKLPSSARFVISLILGRETGRFCDLVDRWLAESGPEWTCGRLKAYRTAALQLRAGHPEKAKAIYQANSIAYHRGTGLPRGPYGVVVGRFVSSRKPSNMKAWDTVLRCYTSIRLKDPSQAQLAKAKASINSPYTGDPGFLSTLEGDAFRWGEALRPIRQQIPLPDPSLTRMKMFTGTYSCTGHNSGYTEVPYGKFVASLLTGCSWPERVARIRTESADLSPWGGHDFIRQIRAEMYEEGLGDFKHTGKIGVVQEAGCKGRFYASPTAYWQWFFEPLHRVLHELQTWFEASVVDDQVDSYYWFLRKEGPMWCFDLSSATDRFPRRLQQALLRGLGFEAYADDLEDACRNWIAPNGETWHYAVGQPMGLYGSFPLFHLTHLLLLADLWEKVQQRVGVGADCCPYRILGDDVIINDRLLAEAYEDALNRLGVEISGSKTITGDQLAEFAGFVFYQSNRGRGGYRPYKFGWKSGIHAPLNLLANVGKRVSTLGPRWRTHWERFSRTRRWRHPDLSPMFEVQRDPGGLWPSPVDATRLGNLITSVSEDLSVFVLYPGGNPFWDPEDIEWTKALGLWVEPEDRIKGLAEQLLNQKPRPRGERRELLSDPHPSQTDESEREMPAGKALAADPLMVSSVEGDSLLSAPQKLTEMDLENGEASPPYGRGFELSRPNRT